MGKLKFGQIMLILLAGLVVIFGGISTLYTDFLWFKALEFQSVFLKILTSKITFFFAGFFVFLIFALINFKIATNLEKESKLTKKMIALLVTLTSLFMGAVASSSWFTILQFLNKVGFNLTDPILMKDVSFYVFTLPFLNQIWIFVFACIVITLLLVSVYYLQKYLAKFFVPYASMNANNDKDNNQDPGKQFKGVNLRDIKIKRSIKNHLVVLLSFAFILVAVKYYLARYSVMYSLEGIVVGAGFTDVNVFLPVVQILMILALVVAVLFYFYVFVIAKNQKLRRRHILIYVLVVYFAFVVIGQGIAPAIVQTLKVDPNELNLEKPYIDNNIEFTRKAYGLDSIEERDFDVSGNLTRDIIESSDETVDNIRILDYRPLTQTYKQTQEIRLYYDLNGIDIDRYNIDGKYTQVMLAPRELNQDQIVDNAKTWVNLHMIYTHGFGLVMSPVNEVTKEGLPDYLVKDIPPVYESEDPSIKIDNPRIYYGDTTTSMDSSYVLVNTDTEEFDYPKGNTNEYFVYDGEGGVLLDNFFDKLMLAFRFGDIKLLLSSDIKADSKIMFTRNIKQRVSKVMPFLELDDDPYVVIDNGKLYWIMDAYTVTGNYPYSEKITIYRNENDYMGNSINYIRNSVKIVVDAYNGDISYYIIDDKDPIIQTYSKIFPNAFKPISEISDVLKSHLRYPVDLFEIQSHIFSVYHMDDTNVFYNKEDAWQKPKEIYGTGQPITMEPYYIVLKLPEEEKPEFVLMTPFTPLRKDNMISWLAARSDGEEYGHLLLYRFPKDKLVYGPSQIEAKIDQDSEISQQLTLWSQQGSRVTRGNLIVIPIETSLLYVEPLYIQAEQGQLPELKRVIVSDGESVVMEETLDQSLEALFGKVTVVSDMNDEDMVDVSLSIGKQANEYYQNILEAMDNGDWTRFGENFDKLGEIIAEISE